MTTVCFDKLLTKNGLRQLQNFPRKHTQIQSFIITVDRDFFRFLSIPGPILIFTLDRQLFRILFQNLGPEERSLKYWVQNLNKTMEAFHS
ncbi:hypothetical protein [Leptospira interrogans]|uniref:hypothetical protein n=1 Tax=Leptospira interrogans TaxID=173 RepID=UPI001F0EE0B4|nr:hypothetical protein [Leptospira interrogans]UMQ59340.1 hypothetical protein FH585_06235 [Leptospira interrogans]